MQLTGISADEFRMVTSLVSRECYDSNLIVNDITDHHGKRRPRIGATLRTVTGKGGDKYSSAPGARRSWSGRRMPAACWHTYRDVLNVLFEMHPDAIVRTSMAVYKGLDGFREEYPNTAYKNIGSQFNPAYMPELCECSDTNGPAFSAPPQYVISFPV
jgi:hypothetical protein